MLTHNGPPTRASEKRAYTTSEIERLRKEFKHSINFRTVLPSSDTAAILLWARLASERSAMNKVDGWQTLATTRLDQSMDLTCETIPSYYRECATSNPAHIPDGITCVAVAT
jgi:hypothetical protein